MIPQPRILTQLVGVSALLAAATLAALAVWIVGSNAIDIIGMDMNVVFGIQRVLLGQPLYSDPAAAPYAITQYTPLYYYLVALPAALTGTSAHEVMAVSALARLVSVVVALSIAVISFHFLRKRVGASRGVSTVAAIFIMCATANWYFAIRPDGLSTLLVLVALYILSGSDKLSLGQLFAVAASAVGAVMAKQNGIIAAVIVVTFLVTARRFADAGVETAMILVLGTLATIAMTATGPAIRANIVDGLNNGMALRAALMNTYRPLFYWQAPLVALCFAALPRLLSRDAPPSDKVIGLGALVAFGFAAVTAVKRGSAENYFNDFMILAVFSVVRTYIINEDRATAERIPRRLVVAFSLYVSAFLLIRSAHQVYTTYLYHRSSPETRLDSQTGPVEYVRRHIDPDKYAIGFAVGLSNGFPERMLVPQQEIATISHVRHQVDYSRFVSDVKSGRVQYAIVPNGVRAGDFLGASFRAFTPIRRFRHYTLYEY